LSCNAFLEQSAPICTKSTTTPIRAALIEGEASGEPQPFDAASFKRGMLALNV
jgi:hypothetical protein